MKEKLDNINIYVVRYSSYHGIRNSAPCLDCYKKLIQFNIKYIIFSVSNTEFIKVKLTNYTPTQPSLGRRFIEAGYDSTKIVRKHIYKNK